MLQRDLRVANLKHEGLWVGNHVLHRHAHFDDVLILGEHDLAQTGGTNFRCIDRNHLIDERRIPLQTRCERRVVLTKPEHNRTLLLVELIKTHQPPDQQHSAENHTQQGTRNTAFRRTTAAAAPSKHASDTLLELFKGLVEIWRALITSAPRVTRAFITAPRLIP